MNRYRGGFICESNEKECILRPLDEDVRRYASLGYAAEQIEEGLNNVIRDLFSGKRKVKVKLEIPKEQNE